MDDPNKAKWNFYISANKGWDFVESVEGYVRLFLIGMGHIPLPPTTMKYENKSNKSLDIYLFCDPTKGQYEELMAIWDFYLFMVDSQRKPM